MKVSQSKTTFAHIGLKKLKSELRSLSLILDQSFAEVESTIKRCLHDQGSIKRKTGFLRYQTYNTLTDSDIKTVFELYKIDRYITANFRQYYLDIERLNSVIETIINAQDDKFVEPVIKMSFADISDILLLRQTIENGTIAHNVAYNVLNRCCNGLVKNSILFKYI